MMGPPIRSVGISLRAFLAAILGRPVTWFVIPPATLALPNGAFQGAPRCDPALVAAVGSFQEPMELSPALPADLYLGKSRQGVAVLQPCTIRAQLGVRTTFALLH